MIEARGLTKRYGDTLAVDNLSFSVEPGKITGFLGPNGAGKTTTMRLILGLDHPTSGSVTVNGQPFARLAHPMREVGALLDAKAVHGGRSAYNHLLCLAADQQPAPAAGGRGARARRPQRGRGQAVQGLLPGHGAAARDRRRAARRPGHPDVRRAGQRAGSRGHPVDPQPDEGAGRRGPHDLRVQPPDVGDGAHRRPPAGDRPGPADLGLHGARVHRGQLAAVGPGAHAAAGRSWAGWSPRPGARRTRTATA